jgi:hypothetical protein
VSEQHDRDERDLDETEPLGPASRAAGRVSTEVSFDADFDLTDDDAVDLARVHADDEFLTMVGAAEPDLADELANDELAALLLSWRREVDGAPIAELVDAKLAVATVHAARARKRRRPRLLAPVAAAAAVLAIAFAGMGIAARDAQPGDTLWGLTRVLYAEHARSVEAAAAVRKDLEHAREALAAGNVVEAKSRLDEAESELTAVSSEDGQADLQARHAELMAQLPDKPADGASSPPSANPTTNPDPGLTTAPQPPPQDTTSSSSPPADTSTSPPTDTTTSESGRNETPPGTGNGPGGEPASTPAGTAGAEAVPATDTP